jgi:hypothetical protein
LFAPGEEVTIDGIMARRDPQGCAFQTGTLADGTHIARNGPIDRSAPAPAEQAVVASDSASIAGNWEPPPRNRGGRARGGPQGRPRPQMTAAAEAALENFDARFDDPALECSPSSIIRVWFEPGMVNQIEVLEDKVIIRHEFMDLVRTVHLATQKPPDGFEPSLAGYSIGHFEGDDLVIQTTGFKAGVLQAHAAGGMLHTDQMHVTERLTLSDDALRLTRDYVVTDPAYYSEPLTGSQAWQRSTKALPKYDCVELSGVSKVRPEDG